MTLVEQQDTYERYVVPESRRVPAEALIAKIDFNKPRPPLLFIAGGADHLIPASLNRTNYVRYKKSLSVTDYKEFPGRVHFTIGQGGWEEVADYVISWLKSQNILKQGRDLMNHTFLSEVSLLQGCFLVNSQIK